MDFIIPSKMCMAIGVYGLPLSRIGISKGVYLFGILGIFFSVDLSMRLGKFPNMLRNSRIGVISVSPCTDGTVALGIVVYHYTRCNDY